jgi:hypothetical protein
MGSCSFGFGCGVHGVYSARVYGGFGESDLAVFLAGFLALLQLYFYSRIL